MTQIIDMGAARLSSALAAGEVSAVEVMRAHLDRIGRVNGAVNAIVSLRDEDELMAEARASDEARASGKATGRLHGLPVAVKDLTATRGLTTTMGSPLYADSVPDHDGLIAARQRDAGAIVIGKTNTPEFGLGSHTMNEVFGTTLNPWNTAYSAGGSSGGASVALATRMLPVADGSDMMGSLRNPAGWANVFGYRPSWGRVPNSDAANPYAHQLSTEGPMGRSVEDVALLLDILAGYDPAAPLSLGDVPAFSAGLAKGDATDDAKTLRIGWIGDWAGRYPMDAGVAETCRSALRVFEALGATVDPLTPAVDPDVVWRSWIALRSWAMAAKHGPEFDDPVRRERIKPEAQWEIERGRALSALDVHDAFVARAAWHRELLDLFSRVDLLAVPSAQTWPFPQEQRWPQTVGGREMDTYHRWMEVMLIASLTGLPAMSAPAGFSGTDAPVEGLPIGVQLIGPPRADLAVLRAAAAYEASADWVHRTPPDPT